MGGRCRGAQPRSGAVSGPWRPRRRGRCTRRILVAAAPEAAGLPYEDLKEQVTAAMTAVFSGPAPVSATLPDAAAPRWPRRPRSPPPRWPGPPGGGDPNYRFYQALRARASLAVPVLAHVLGLRPRRRRAPRRRPGIAAGGAPGAAVSPLGRPRRGPGAGMSAPLVFASTIGQVFKPLYELLAGIIAFSTRSSPTSPSPSPCSRWW